MSVFREPAFEWTGCPSADAVTTATPTTIMPIIDPPSTTVRTHIGQQGRHSKMDLLFLFHRKIYVATLFKLLGWAGRPAPCALRVSDQSGIGYKIVIARQPWDLSLKTTACPRAAPSVSGLFSTINSWLPCYNYYIHSTLFACA